MLKKIKKFSILGVALGWPIILAELLPQAYFPEIMVVAVVNGLVLGIWAFS